MKHLLYATGLTIMLAAFFTPNTAQGSTKSAKTTNNDIAQFCTRENYSAMNKQWVWCAAEVKGVMEGIHVGALYVVGWYTRKLPKQNLFKPSLKPARIYCLPDGVTPSKAALAVANYIKSNPNMLNDPNMQVEPEAQLVIKSFQETWPCADKKSLHKNHQ